MKAASDVSALMEALNFLASASNATANEMFKMAAAMEPDAEGEVATDDNPGA